MGMIFLYLIFFILYFLLVGFLSILESKVLGLVQSSSSISSVGVFSLYHYILDFFKMFFKGVDGSMVLKSFSYIFLMFYFSIVIGSVFFLPLSKFGSLLYYGFLFFMFLDSSFFLFKMIMLNIYIFKFMDFCNYKVKSVYIYGEVLSIFLYLLLFILFGCYKVCGLNLNLGMGLSFFIISLLLLLLFVILLVSVFKTPFDYLEMESEFVGGLILELQGLLFVFWSLVEYLIILNSVVFLCSVVLSLFLLSFFGVVFIVLVLFILIMVFFSSSMFLSISFKSYFFLLSKMFSLGLWCCVVMLLCFCF